MASYAAGAKSLSTVDFIVNIIPTTFVDAFAKGEILQVLLISVLFGLVLAKMGDKGKLLVNVIDQASHALFGIIGMIMYFAPIGAFGAMAFTIGKYGVGSLVQLGQLMAAVYLTCFLFVAIVLGAIARFTGFSLWKFIRYIKEELLIVLGTSSSESALPRMIAKLENLGCAKPVVGMVVPTGYSFNLDGTSIYLTMAAIFIAQATNVDLTLGQQLTILGVLLLTSKGGRGGDRRRLRDAGRHPVDHRHLARGGPCPAARHRPVHVGGARDHQSDRQWRRDRGGRQMGRGAGHRTHGPCPRRRDRHGCRRAGNPGGRCSRHRPAPPLQRG